MESNYPEHKHPHGIIGEPNEHRIWVCEECEHIFSDMKRGRMTHAASGGILAY